MDAETKPAKPTREFVANFDAACLHYGCTEAEQEEMRVEARKKLADAIPCFAALAREIFGPEHGINKRIEDSIEVERNQEKQP